MCMHEFHRFMAVALLAALLAACAQTPGQPDLDDDVLIPPTTKVLDAATRSALLDVRADGTLTFSAITGVLDDLEPGDVIASEPAPSAPEGLLRKVTTIRVDDDIIVVETVGAELREAIHHGSLHVRLELDPEDLEESIAQQSGVIVQAFEHTLDTDFGTDGSIRAIGTLSIDPILDFRLGLHCGRKIGFICAEIPSLRVRAELGIEQTANVDMTGDGLLGFNENLPIATHRFSPITFFIGPVPVVLTPALTIYVGAFGSMNGVFSFEVDQDLTLTAGFSYDSSSGFEDISRNESSFERRGSGFQGTVDTRAFIGASYAVRLYGVIGPRGALEAGPSFRANLSGLPADDHLLWALDGCVRLFVGIESVSVLDISYEKTLFNGCTPFVMHENSPPSVSILSPTASSQVYVGVPLMLRSQVVDVDGHDVSCTWTSTRSSDGVPSTCDGEATFLTTGSRTLTLLGTDAAGASASAVVTIVVQSVPDVLVTIVSPAEGVMVGPHQQLDLSGSASGGTAPHAFAWSVAYPTDAAGNGGVVHAIGSGATLDWTPSDTLTFASCEVDAFARLQLEATDATDFTGARSIVIRISQLC